MKWNSHQARQSGGDGAEWSDPEAMDSHSSPPPGMYRDNYYHVIATNTESRCVTVRTLDGALQFWNALKR